MGGEGSWHRRLDAVPPQLLVDDDPSGAKTQSSRRCSVLVDEPTEDWAPWDRTRTCVATPSPTRAYPERLARPEYLLESRPEERAEVRCDELEMVAVLGLPGDPDNDRRLSRVVTP
jgi:hypothetical protein